MHRIIAGATGLIGTELVNHWLEQQIKITVIGRTVRHIRQVFGKRVTALTWDKLRPTHLSSADAVINLAGANIGDRRWTAKRKQQIINSRIDSTKILSDMLASMGEKAPPLLNASAIGIYGLQQQTLTGLPEALDENTQLHCDKPSDFLAEIGCQWEKATESAKAKAVRVIHLRFGVVLAKSGGALPKLVLPFKLFAGGVVGTGHQPFTWVAIEDVVRAIDFLLSKEEASGPYNIVAPQAVSQKVLAETIGSILDRPVWLHLPDTFFKFAFGAEMAEDLLLEGQHVVPARLTALGFQYAYPDIESALRHLLQ